MKQFGFHKPDERQINLDDNDLRAAGAIELMVQSWKRCIGCGSCTASCTAGQFNGFNPRRLQMLVRLGCYTLLKSEIQKCQLCGKCRLVCPRGVDTRKLMHHLKQLEINL